MNVVITHASNAEPRQFVECLGTQDGLGVRDRRHDHEMIVSPLGEPVDGFADRRFQHVLHPECGRLHPSLPICIEQQFQTRQQGTEVLLVALGQPRRIGGLGQPGAR